MLEALDRGNLFLVPLDDRRRWYRYHHLFADVLRARLLDEQPERVPDLHRRASEWYEAERRAVRGDPPRDGRRRLRASGGPGRARDPGACASVDRRPAAVGWLEALPDEVLRGQAGAQRRVTPGRCWSMARLEGVEARLRDAERWLNPAGGGDMLPNASSTRLVVVDEAEFRRLPSVDRHPPRRRWPRAVGDVAGTIAHARRALDLVDEDDHLGVDRRSRVPWLAYWTNGDLEAAYRAWTAAHGQPREGRVIVSDVIGGTLALADIRSRRDACATRCAPTSAA